MVAYTKEERERRRGDNINFIDFRFGRKQVIGFRKERRQDISLIASSLDEG